VDVHGLIAQLRPAATQRQASLRVAWGQGVASSNPVSPTNAPGPLMRTKVQVNGPNPYAYSFRSMLEAEPGGAQWGPVDRSPVLVRGLTSYRVIRNSGTARTHAITSAVHVSEDGSPAAAASAHTTAR
jgi:hypothetical protein